MTALLIASWQKFLLKVPRLSATFIHCSQLSILIGHLSCPMQTCGASSRWAPELSSKLGHSPFPKGGRALSYWPGAAMTRYHTPWVMWTTEMFGRTLLEARSSKARCGEGRSPLRAVRGLPVPSLRSSWWVANPWLEIASPQSLLLLCVAASLCACLSVSRFPIL